MKSGFRLLSVILIIFAVSACAPMKPRLNQTFLPNSQKSEKEDPTPKHTIQFSQEILELIKEHRQFDIFWISEDNILITVGDFGAFIILPSTDEIQSVEGAELEVMMEQIKQRSTLEVTESKGGAFFKDLLSFGGGADRNTPYSGSICDEGKTSQVSIVYYQDFEKSSSGGGLLGALLSRPTCQRADFKMHLENQEFETEVDATVWASCHESDVSIKRMLEKTRISPDGNYYYFTNRFVLLDSKNKAVNKLVEFTGYEYQNSIVNPAWSEVAFVTTYKMPKDKQINGVEWGYKIDFYDAEFTQ